MKIGVDRNNVAPGITLSIVVPAYNESENLADAIGFIASGLPDSLLLHEIIIVDDGSKDDTAAVLNKVSAEYPNIHSIIHPANRGKGAALQSAIRIARMEWVLFMDADLQISIDELPVFLEQVAEYEIIIGTRKGRKDPFIRRILSSVFAGIIRFFIKLDVNDLNCPFKLIKKSFLDSCTLQSQGFLIDTEILYKASRMNLPIKEIAVSCQTRQKGISTVRFAHAIETLAELMRLLARKNQ